MTSNTFPVIGAPTGRTLPWLLPAAVLLLVALVYTPDPSVPATPEPSARSNASAVGAKAALGLPPIDHSAVDWDRLPLSPDAAPMSVAAYGN